MLDIVQKFRGALRWLAVSAACLIAAVAVFAASLPFLIDGQTVRESLIQSLSAWSGGPVIIDGPLRITSFTTFAIEASGVRLPATVRLSPVARIKAKSVTAIAKLSALLRGRLEFKTVVVMSPEFIFERGETAAASPSFGLETLESVAAAGFRSPFANLELIDPVFATARSGRSAFRRHHVQQIRLAKATPATLPLMTLSPSAWEEQKTPVNLSVRTREFEAFFRGELGSAGETGAGAFRLHTVSNNSAAKIITAILLPWEPGSADSVTGELGWANGRISLDGATIAFADRRASGSLALATSQGRSRLEGTLAYDRLDLTREGEQSHARESTAGLSLPGPAAAYLGNGKNLDLDIRISADRFRAGAFEAGPLAVTLTSRRDILSADIAELAAFGGSMKGRLDFDPAHPALLSVNASGFKLDSRLLADTLHLPLILGGPFSGHAGLAIPVATSSPDIKLRSATGHFDVRFPAGGALDGEFFRTLTTATSHGDRSWKAGAEATPFAFSSASIVGTLGPDGIDLMVDGESASGRITGSVRLDLSGSAVNGTLSFNPGGETAAPSSSNIPLNIENFVPPGPPAALSVSSTAKPDF